MTLFTHLTTECIAKVRMPALREKIQIELINVTLALHRMRHFVKDARVADVTFGSVANAQTILTDSLVGYRDIWNVTYVNTDSTPGEALTYTSPQMFMLKERSLADVY